MGPVSKEIPGAGKTQHRSCCFCVLPAWKLGEKRWKMEWTGSGSCLRGAFRSPESSLRCWRRVCALSCQPCSGNLSPFASQQEIPTFHLNGSSPQEATFLLLFGIGAISCLGAPLSHWEKHFEWLLSEFWITDVNGHFLMDTFPCWWSFPPFFIFHMHLSLKWFDNSVHLLLCDLLKFMTGGIGMN